MSIRHKGQIISNTNTIEDIKIHGISATIDSNKGVDLSVVEQVYEMPTITEELDDRVVQYLGETTSNYTNGYFYKAHIAEQAYEYDASSSVNPQNAEVSITDITTLNTFYNNMKDHYSDMEKMGIISNTSSSEVSCSIVPNDDTSRVWWSTNTNELITLAGITITGDIRNAHLFIVSKENPQPAHWERISVQPETELVWGNITGTLSEQTDLQNALDAKQDTLTAGTGISIKPNTQTGELVISSTSSESFYRGTFATWTLVPTNPTSYVEDPVHHLKTPTNTDYMIVTDASDYYKPGAEITIQLKGYIGGTGYVLELSGKWSDTLIAYNTPYERVYGNNELIINFDSNGGAWSWRVRFNIPVVLNGTRYDAYDVWTGASGSTTRVFNEIVDQPCEGTWRFGYYGEWDTAGRNGWVAEYKIEDTLPIATDTVAGIMKLYTTTGSNTDGTMNQNSITTALGTKQNTLNAGNNITIDQSTSTISGPDKTLVSFVIWEDDTPTPGE